MLRPPQPPNETQRLASLHRLGILDTPPEERFDRITRTAQRVFDVPIALVSLVDTDRQWFKSCQGLAARETSRDISFCGHAILNEDIMVVTDARHDPRFADNPLVTGEPHIRFYAGHPLKARDGHRLGTLCLIDRRARPLDTADRLTLHDLAAWAESELHVLDLDETAGAILDSETRLRAVLVNVLNGIVMLSQDGLIELLNPAAEGLFGYASAELIGRHFTELLPEPHHQEYQNYLHEFLRTGQPRILGRVRETTALRKDGKVIAVDLGVSASTIDGQLRFIATVHDITARKQAERLKNEFISVVSHELRTPLTAIKGALGLIAGGIAGKLPEQAANLIDIAHKNSERLAHLIDDMLDVEKIESGKMAFALASIEITPLVEQAIEANRTYAAPHQVDIVLSERLPDARVVTDPGRLTQVLANLLSNAVKFSPRGGTVGVTVTRHDGRVRVAVRDCGSGIPAEFQARIFQKFAQADASDARGKGGTGLGLNISKSIIERLGGRIGFETRPGAGTTFYFDLPEEDAPVHPLG